MSPNYFMPYTGFFSEKLKRDKEVLKYNKKNSIDDYLKFCELNKIEVLNVLKNDVYKFSGVKLIEKKNMDIQVAKDLRPEKYLEYYKKEFQKIDENYIKEYFLKADELLSKNRIKAYIGFDCTSDCLHVGSLMQIMILRLLQKHGHQPIVLFGGGTTLIGDPSGKDSTRKIIQKKQLKKILRV